MRRSGYKYPVKLNDPVIEEHMNITKDLPLILCMALFSNKARSCIDIIAYGGLQGASPASELLAGLCFKVSSPTLQICHAVQS